MSGFYQTTAACDFFHPHLLPDPLLRRTRPGPHVPTEPLLSAVPAPHDQEPSDLIIGHDRFQAAAITQRVVPLLAVAAPAGDHQVVLMVAPSARLRDHMIDRPQITGKQDVAVLTCDDVNRKTIPDDEEGTLPDGCSGGLPSFSIGPHVSRLVGRAGFEPAYALSGSP